MADNLETELSGLSLTTENTDIDDDDVTNGNVVTSSAEIQVASGDDAATQPCDASRPKATFSMIATSPTVNPGRIYDFDPNDRRPDNSEPCSDRKEDHQVHKRHSLTRRDSEDFGIIELKSADANVRARAALRLATRARNDEVVEALRDALDDSSRLVRESAALTLGHMKVEEAVPKLIDLWRNDVVSNVRQGAQLSLKFIGSESAQEAIQLTDMIESAVDRVDFAVLERFIGSDNVDTGGLIRTLNGNNANGRAAAAIGLSSVSETSPDVLEALIHALEDKDRLVRQAACTSLGSLNVSRCVPRLATIWRNDFISSVRRAAGVALERIGGTASKNAVMETGLLSQAINTLAGKGGDAGEFVEGLTSNDRLVREASCLALGKLKSESSIQALVDTWSNDPISNVRQSASYALEQIGGAEADKAMGVTNSIAEEIAQLSKAKLYRSYSITE